MQLVNPRTPLTLAAEGDGAGGGTFTKRVKANRLMWQTDVWQTISCGKEAHTEKGLMAKRLVWQTGMYAAKLLVRGCAFPFNIH